MIEDNRVELKRVEYPIEETIARIEATTLPDPRETTDEPFTPHRPPTRSSHAPRASRGESGLTLRANPSLSIPSCR